MAALVSVSPPLITVSVMASSRLWAWRSCQWADAHHGAVGLAVGVGSTTEPARDSRTAVEGPGIQPRDVNLASLLPNFSQTCINLQVSEKFINEA